MINSYRKTEVSHALAARGLSADVVERDTEARNAGAGLYLPANAVRALHALGMSTELARLAQPVQRQEIRNHRGRLLTGFDVSAIWGEVGECLAIRRADLHGILLAASGGAHVLFGTAVNAVGPDGTVIFDDGSQATYDLVVGADGIDSAVRHSAFPETRPKFLGQICWRFLAAPADYVEPGTWTVRLGSRGRSFLTLPLGDGEVYCYADINSATPQAPAGDWRALFANFAPPVTKLLDQCPDAHFAALHEIPGSAWVHPRVVLIGDAAHACSPSMAQGGAMALEDALVLAALLTTAEDRQAVPALLRAYRQRRAGRVRFVLEQNRRRDRARDLPGWLRDVVLRRFGVRLFQENHSGLLTEP